MALLLRGILAVTFRCLGGGVRHGCGCDAKRWGSRQHLRLAEPHSIRTKSILRGRALGVVRGASPPDAMVVPAPGWWPAAPRNAAGCNTNRIRRPGLGDRSLDTRRARTGDETVSSR